MADDDGSTAQGAGDAEPQGGDGKTAQGASTTSTTSTTTTGADALAAKVAELERDNKKYRDAIRKHEEAKLSETERLQGKLTDAERTNERLAQSLSDARTERAIERAAQRAGFIDPEDAVLTLNRSSLKYDDDGAPMPESLDKALAALAKAKPHLIGGSDRGSWDGGARRTSPAGTDMNDRIRDALRR